MNIDDYNKIVHVINTNSYEKLLYLEIERICRERNLEVFQMSMEDYVEVRNYLDQVNRERIIRNIGYEHYENVENTGNEEHAVTTEDTEEKPKKQDQEKKDMVIAVFVILVTAILGWLLIFSSTNLILQDIGILLWLVSFILIVYVITSLLVADYPSFVDSRYAKDRAEEYFRIQRETKIKYDAYMSYARLHSNEIKNLKHNLK